MSAITDPPDMYPLATPEGNYIPLEVINPIGFVKIVTDATVYVVSELVDADLIIIYADVPCNVRFDGIAAIDPPAGVYQPDSLFLPEYTVGGGLVLDARDAGGASWDGSVSAIQAKGQAGLLFMLEVVRYQHLRTPFRIGNR